MSLDNSMAQKRQPSNQSRPPEGRNSSGGVGTRRATDTSRLTWDSRFRRARHILGVSEPHLLGSILYLWLSAASTSRGVVGDGLDVELAAMWPGSPGALTAALERVGLIRRLDDGRYLVLDLDGRPIHATSLPGGGE